ncbi:unnamed protein product [Mesocestoides corti]|uniref:Uncharacterized protein n=1 Tax=Mesocestoides corti TaxID=53468 RepID=A0A0R3UCT6_MESCO|nr:unnamed protein product [Mesocestoides corti]
MRCPGILDPRNILDDNQLQQQQRLPQALNRRSMSSLSYSTSQTPVDFRADRASQDKYLEADIERMLLVDGIFCVRIVCCEGLIIWASGR